MFLNHFDAYNITDEEDIPVMTEEKFVEIVGKLLY